MLICPNCRNQFEDDKITTCPVCKSPLIESGNEPEHASVPAFVKSSDKYEDLKSSGYTLIITSLAGFIFIILKAFDIIPLYFEGFSEYMFYFVMSGMFIAFMVTGILSLKKAGQIKGHISTEEDTEKRIIEFFTENYSAKDIDAKLNAHELSEGELYYSRYDYIKNTIQSNFENIDKSFSDHLVEEIYQKLYENDED